MTVFCGGSKLLFNKKIEPSCSYCTFGGRISPDEVICIKKGIVSSAGKCRKFKYDPLKREPPVHLKLKTDELSEEDFSLD